MTKLSKKNASTRRKVAASKPVTQVKTSAEELAAFDHDGDGHPGGSKSRGPGPVTEVSGSDQQVPATEPTVGAVPEVVEGASIPVLEVEAPAAAPPTVEVKPSVKKAPEPSAQEDRVMLGPVECRLRHLPTKTVLGLLSEQSLRRVDAHHGSASFEATRKRMLASNGRATPIFFEDGSSPTLLHGYDELASAVDCGVASLDVLLIPAGGAAEAQAHIVEMVRLQSEKQDPSDDEMFWRHAS